MAKHYFKRFVTNRFNAWLKQRVPGRSHHKLTRKNIFILPTKFGFAYLFLVFLLFLLATNYQNNIIMLMSYLLASFFITVMMHSFYNFSGLEIRSKSKHSGFSKQILSIPISIISTKQHLDLTLSVVQQPQQQVYLAHCDSGTTDIILPYLAKQRGIVDSGRIKISSEYSFGLFVAWSVLDFSHQLTVYPQPKKISANQYQHTGQETDHEGALEPLNQSAGLDDFAELKSYVLGEPLSRIAWKQFARGQGKHTKHYQNQQANLHWLNLKDMPVAKLELQLSYLCYLVLEYSHSEQCFGLDLITDRHSTMSLLDGKVAPDVGFIHQQACLTALAKFSLGTGYE